MTLNRRRFIQSTSAMLWAPFRPSLALPRPSSQVCLGVIADLHHGLEPSAMSRLETFMDAVSEKKPDALIQMGDFNYGDAMSRECLALWRQFSGPRFHVLGNHDMDKVSKDAIVDSWEMPSRYYSFDLAAWHFVVLDRNNLRLEDRYTPYARANFYVDAMCRGHADPEQLEWLSADLKKTNRPTAVFVHQGLGMTENPSPEDARTPIEKILEEAKREDGSNKVVATFCGHHHLDRYKQKNGVHYVWVNSVSYYWVGGDYGRMAPYKEPLFAFATFREDGTVEVEGKRTVWSEPSPTKRGYPQAEELTPWISNRRFS